LFVSLAGLVGPAILAGRARAETPPNVWEMAKTPELRTAYALHIEVRQALAAEGGAATTAAVLERARARLEEAHAETSPDVRLRFDLGEVYEHIGRHEKAAEVLAAALKDAPDHPGAVDALYILAIAYARLDRANLERETYRRFLAKVTDDRARANALLNLAEAEMRAGDLETACADYQEAIDVALALPNVASASNTAILAVWGLSVALDRSGDPGGAARQVKLAVSMDPEERYIGNTTTVFFVPEYDRHWYLGLGRTERARQAAEARTAAFLWTKAEEEWAGYVTEADPKDRWLPLARAHLARVRAERAQAERRAGPPSSGAERAVPRSPPDPTH
jgi:tetratricopeptide (TPR) repeat protein